MTKKEDYLKGNQEEADASNPKQRLSRSDFPPDFVFGTATSAYQVEGAAKEGGRGPCIWDAFSQAEGNIIDESNGDVAVDQYHKYKGDVELISSLGFDAYRFSISWSRIFPDGLGTKVNDKGITYYNNLIDELLAKGRMSYLQVCFGLSAEGDIRITPYVTLYHWDLPLHLDETMGGWLNKHIVNYFAIYAETCFESFGDRVKNWATINEPLKTAINGYGSGIFAPGRREISPSEQYLVAHHQILAHGKAVSIYHNKYKEKQGGQIGLVLNCEWAEPYSDKVEDNKAAARRLDFQLGWYLDPIYYGDYPECMRENVGDKLPTFSDEEKQLIRNTMDFLGLNHYTTRLIAHRTESPQKGHFFKSQHMERLVKSEDGELIGEKAASEWHYIVPWGIRMVLNYVSQRYSNPPIFVTENGMDDEDNDTSPLEEMLDDKLRVRFYEGYIAAVAQAIRDGVDVRGYFAWSLLDNFEWDQGYTKRFGLVYVDYKNGLTRHLKSSAYWFLLFLKGHDEKNGEEE